MSRPSYEITNSETNYSDFGAIRAQLEYEKITGKSLYRECEKLWDPKIVHWSEVETGLVVSGERNYKPIKGDVHDPNAWVVKEKVAHAGLFSSIDGISNTLLNLEKEFTICPILKAC